jgi:hypothetical protein
MRRERDRPIAVFVFLFDLRRSRLFSSLMHLLPRVDYVCDRVVYVNPTLRCCYLDCWSGIIDQFLVFPPKLVGPNRVLNYTIRLEESRAKKLFRGT